MTDNKIFQGIILVQAGKILQDGQPLADNIQVHPAKGSVIVGDPEPILRALRQRYPKCAFTWFADPVAGEEVRGQKSDVSQTAPPAGTPGATTLDNLPVGAPADNVIAASVKSRKKEQKS
jgi:hypothetical protein